MISRLPFQFVSGMVCACVVSVCLMVSDVRAQQGGHEAPPPTVITAQAVRLTEPSFREFPGIIESIRRVDCVARVSGYQLRTHFTEGSLVKEGDLLFSIEDTTHRAALDTLLAKREQLSQSLLLAKREYERSSKLIAKEIVTESAHDNASCAYRTAEAAMKEIAASITDAENNLSYTKVHAPITGRIGKASFTDGNLVSLSSGPLASIEQTAPIYVRFALSERTFRKDFGGLAGIRDTAVVRLRLADGTTYGEQAAITLIDNKIDRSTNTITLWATFRNADGALIPGGYATVLLARADRRNPVAVVPSAVVFNGEGHIVYVVGEDGVARTVPVTVGQLAEGRQIILTGLKGTETVIVEGTNKVVPGKPVRAQAASARE